MNIVERARRFWQGLRDLAGRTEWNWRICPHCGGTLTEKWGGYRRRPWYLEGRQVVRVQRHRCQECRKTYSEQSALLVRRSWYGREVHRFAIDHWQHVGSSVRRTAELLPQAAEIAPCRSMDYGHPPYSGPAVNRTCAHPGELDLEPSADWQQHGLFALI